MVVCKSGERLFSNVVTDGRHEVSCDATADKGGNGDGFTPTSLVECALAACINITLRKYADVRGIKLHDVVAKVSMNRDDPKKTLIEEEVQLIGELTEKERAVLIKVAKQCPVQKILTGELSFNLIESGS